MANGWISQVSRIKVEPKQKRNKLSRWHEVLYRVLDMAGARNRIHPYYQQWWPVVAPRPPPTATATAPQPPPLTCSLS
ncbi:hypothetical protein QQP08_011592 [Theobroma cacao]|nr:hypothetical protein QQP08_011592 [Theobroma cacao]